MTDPAARLVFIGGAPRSGTTLLRRILGAHSRIYAGPEFDVVPDFVRLHARLTERVRMGRIGAVVDEAGVDRAVGGALREMLEAKAAREGAEIYVEKSPHNVLVFSGLLEMYPDARCILVLRDPRAIAASMKEVARRYRADGKEPPPFCRSARASAQEIARYWEAGFAALKACPDRVIAIHHEDVTAEPEAAARRLCDFLSIAYEPGMLRIEEKDYDRGADADIDKWYTPAEFARPIERGGEEKWRAVLTPGEAGLVAHLAPEHPLLARYDPGGPPPASVRLMELRHRLARRLIGAGRRAARRLGG